jgi:hypothetical protein
MAPRNFQPSPANSQVRNLANMSCALGGVAMSLYTVHFLAWGMGGYLHLLMFLPIFSAWSWTVVVTLGLWGMLTGWSVTTLFNTWGKPPGDRNAISYAHNAVILLIAGCLLVFGVFVPVPNYRDYPLAWQAATAANYFLRTCYIGGAVEALAFMLLPMLPTQGAAEKQMTVRVSDRNQPMTQNTKDWACSASRTVFR